MKNFLKKFLPIASFLLVVLLCSADSGGTANSAVNPFGSIQANTVGVGHCCCPCPCASGDGGDACHCPCPSKQSLAR